MIVQKTSVFSTPRDVVFQKLQRPETLRTIAKPYPAFEPVNSAAALYGQPAACHPGICSSLAPSPSARIPSVSCASILRRSAAGKDSKHVPVWNHAIPLVPIHENRTEYTDRVEIRAGWKTIFIWLWAKAFYAHRQRKWIMLLRKGEILSHSDSLVKSRPLTKLLRQMKRVEACKGSPVPQRQFS